MGSTTYAAWSKIAPITIANAPSVADYPVRIDLTYASPMASDFADIRFVDSSDNALSYWIESYTASTSAVVWVKVASGTEAISVVYGNAAATSESDGADVFSLFDDFGGSSVDTTKWTVNSNGGGTVADGAFTVTAPTTTKGIYSKASFGADYAVSIRASMPATQWGFIGFSTSSRTTQTLFAVSNTGGVTYTVSDALETQACALTAGYHKYDVARNGSANVKFSIDGTLKTTHATRVPTVALPVYLHVSGDVTLLVDWVYVRKYQATEPVCAVGDAEANGGSSGVAGAAGKFLCLLRR